MRTATATVNGKTFTFRAATLEEWDRFRKKVVGATKKAAAIRELAQCCLEPASDLEALQATFAARPVFPTLAAEAIQKLAGAELTGSEVGENDTGFSFAFPTEGGKRGVGEIFSFSAPTLEDWEDFQDRVAGADFPDPCWREIITLCCSSSNKDRFAAKLAEYPAVSGAIADGIGVLAGAKISVVVKKG